MQGQVHCVRRAVRAESAVVQNTRVKARRDETKKSGLLNTKNEPFGSSPFLSWILPLGSELQPTFLVLTPWYKRSRLDDEAPKQAYRCFFHTYGLYLASLSCQRVATSHLRYHSVRLSFVSRTHV